ncbi:hypothetical protein V1502_11020 [Bacillus sp. SCS-153A]|uniref:hypothetical protein n=1 Tax=Rossellomorea sedimentorum TaxID=3115294 RepID=UPI0039058868
MKRKVFWFPLLAALGSTAILYAIGNVFEIQLLRWFYYEEITSDEFSIEAGGSIIPVFIGCLVGFITEQILKNKNKSRTDLV